MQEARFAVPNWGTVTRLQSGQSRQDIYKEADRFIYVSKEARAFHQTQQRGVVRH